MLINLSWFNGRTIVAALVTFSTFRLHRVCYVLDVTKDRVPWPYPCSSVSECNSKHLHALLLYIHFNKHAHFTIQFMFLI